jgi:hypothetical protein
VAFFPYTTIWQIGQQGAYFLMRISQQAAGFAKRTRRLGSDDWCVRFTPSPCTRRKFPGLPSELTCRLIRYQKRGFRPSWLLTPLLSVDLCSRDELIELYHRRWSIETIYREWKHGLDIQNLRSHSPLGILKEVHAQLILSNLIRWIMAEATENTDQTPLDLSFLTTVTLIKNTTSCVLNRHSSVGRKLHFQLLLNIRSAVIRKRPGRSYPRPSDGKIKNRGHGKYQLPPKLKKSA